MARRNIFDRAREFIAGTSRRIREVVSDFFERSNDREDNEELREIVDFESAAGDENQPIINEVSGSDSDIDSDEVESESEFFAPEGDPEDETPDEEFESEFNFEYGDFNQYDPTELRR